MYEIPCFTATAEQIEYANAAIERSLNYKFSNYLEPHSQDGIIGKTWRFFGFLGEVLFADAYELSRPKESFGLNGQDEGIDFIINGYKVDVKTTQLRSVPTSAHQLSFKPNARVVGKANTDYYFFISIHEANSVYTAYFAGGALSKAIREGHIGTAFKKGDKMPYNKVREYDGIALNATEFTPIKITPILQRLPNFQIAKLY